MKETWKDAVGFEGRYEVSNLGRVRSHVSSFNGKEPKEPKTKILRDAENKGYRRVLLISKEGKRCNIPVHRLVAAAFLGDCTNMEINHIDCDKTNNRVDNLEICTQSQNTIHAYKHGLMKPCNNGLWKKIELLKDGLVIGVFASIRLMCREKGLDRKSVIKTIKGEYKHHHGYNFRLV